jgi:hypothetical protein
MKQITTLFAVLVVSTASAQLINGSFEQLGAGDLSGWVVTTTCVSPASSTVVPGGTGAWSARLMANSDDCLVVDPFTLAQPLPWITSGEWILSGWMKAPTVDSFEPTRVYLREGTVPPFVIQYGGLWYGDTSWAFVSHTFNIPVEVQPDSVWIVAFSTFVAGTDPHYAYLDELSLVPNGPTSLHNDQLAELVFRPNPAANKLWVDLAEAPTSVTVVDASGRDLPMRTFHHNAHTLEVDVSSVPTGLCVMLLRSASGVRMLRFIKA